jgi:tRNA threonylcarbamoyladenosine biosynthesis protein TsaE
MTRTYRIEELETVAKEFLQQEGNVFLFHGEMGAGKTTLITAICQAAGVTDTVSSPTFSLINEYNDKKGGVVYHMDLYRLKDEAEAEAAGVEDCLRSGALCLVEWPERAPGLFDETAVPVYIEVVDAATRKLRTGGDARETGGGLREQL